MKKRAFAVLFASLATLWAGATSTRYFTSGSQNLWDGKPFGVVVYRDGTFSKGADWGDPEKLSSAPVCSVSDGDAIYIGTTSPAELIVFRGGKPEKLASFDEAMVTSIAAGGGRIFAGTASPAKIYEIAGNGGKKELAKLEGEAVGSLLVTESGALIAGTSSPAAVHEILPAGGSRKIATLSSNYARCLVKERGAIYVGTSGPAMLYRIDQSDRLTLLDSFEEEEVAGIAPDGGTLMLILNPKKERTSEGAESRCVLYSADSGSVTASKMGGPLVSVWGREGRFFAVSGDGRLYFLEKGKAGLARRFEAQPALLCGAGAVPSVAFSSPPGVSLPLRGGTARYESPVINAGGASKAGPLKASVAGQSKVFLRAGNREKPDDSWSAWLAGPDFSAIGPSKYFQWKCEFGAAGDDLMGVTVTVKPLNRPPVIEEAKVHPPGEIFIKNPSQIGDRLVQDVHEKPRPFPEIAVSRPFDAGTQTYYLYGFRMISFTVSDPDGDEVRSKIELFPEGSGKGVVLGENLKENFFTFDARTLPDGLYKVVITASDSPGNQEGDAKEGERVLPYFEIDNTPPLIELINSTGGFFKFRVSDNTGVDAARVSRDGDKWEVVESLGGAVAPKSADFQVKVGPGDNWIVFRAADGYGNVSSKAWIGKN